MFYGSRFETSGFLPAKSLDRKKNHPPWLAALVWQHCMAPGPFRIVACEQDQYSRAGLGGDVDQRYFLRGLAYECPLFSGWRPSGRRPFYFSCLCNGALSRLTGKSRKAHARYRTK